MDYATQFTQPFVGEASERRRRVEQRLNCAPFLAEPLRRLGYDSTEGWAWDNYRPTVLALAQTCLNSGRHHQGRVRLLEIGGGRGPLLTPAEAKAAAIELTVNDIDARELSLAPAQFDKAQFDVAGEIDPSWDGCFDLDHFADGVRACAQCAARLGQYAPVAGPRRRRACFSSDALRASVRHQLRCCRKGWRRKSCVFSFPIATTAAIQNFRRGMRCALPSRPRSRPY